MPQVKEDNNISKCTKKNGKDFVGFETDPFEMFHLGPLDAIVLSILHYDLKILTLKRGIHD